MTLASPLLFALLAQAPIQPPAGAAPTRVYVWEVPQAIDAVDVPERIEAGGVPVAIHAVRSKERPEALFASLRAQFERKGLFIPPPSHLPLRGSDPQLTGLDPDTLIAYTVFLQVNGDGTTTAVFTETFLTERRTAAMEVDFAPVMPGARGVLQTRTEGFRVLSYRAPATEEEAWDFHRQVLAGASFQETARGLFWRDGEELRISVRPDSKGGVSVSVLARPTLELPRQSPLALDDEAPDP